ncbi:MAG: hypothetical protein JRI91_13200 [Deltaproteobacteria bacterium]|nr:hypothetical protein [Deltaproteobacteria bacterium]
MNKTLSLIKPRVLSIKNRTESGTGIFFAAIGLLFWAGIFTISLRVLSYFKSIEGLGDILAFKLLSMIIVTLFSLLVFSSILTTLSKLFLSRDLLLVHSFPVPAYKIFTARLMESSVDSSWMMILFTLPVFISYGIVYQAGPLFYPASLLTLLLLSILASAVSAILVMPAVIITPAGKIRSIFIFLGLALFLILFLSFRMLRPERLVDPEVFATTLVYLRSLKTPSSPFYPTTWAYDSLKAILSCYFTKGLLNISLLLTSTGALSLLSVILADKIYYRGFSKAQTAIVRGVSHSNPGKRRFNFFNGPTWAVAIKEIKIFFRDQTQWSQLFLITGLVIIYVYNFSVLPLERAPIKTVYLQNILSFLNMGLAAFVLTAVTARFAFPAVSLERDAWWLLNSAPITKKTILRIKFLIYFFPLLVLTEILIIATNLLLNVTPFMMGLSVITIFFMVPAVVSAGIGLGAAYPDFKSENPAQAVTSFGGFLFMVLSAGYIALIIILEAGPVYNIFMANFQERDLTFFEWAWTGVSFFIALILSILAVILSMNFGEKRLSARIS